MNNNCGNFITEKQEPLRKTRYYYGLNENFKFKIVNNYLSSK